MLLLRDDHFLNVWDYTSMFNEVDCPMINNKKRNRGSGDRYKKRFSLRCMVSFSNDSLHVCQGKCLENIESHVLDSVGFLEDSIKCNACERKVNSEFCFESHKVEKLNGGFKSYCEFLSSLKHCSPCKNDFELCLRFGKKRKLSDDRRVTNYYFSNNTQKCYVKCGFCSDFYIEGSSSHSCFLKCSDFIFGNESRQLMMIKAHNVFYYDIESCLESHFECKFQWFDDQGTIINVKKAQIYSSMKQVNMFKETLTDEESECLIVSKCKSHQPTLLCVVNGAHSIKKHFCELEFNNDSIKSFFRWVVDDVVKPTNSSKAEKNDYIFVAHNGSVYNTQFIYCSAHDFFGTKNVKVLLHMNKIIELQIQIHTGFRLSTIYFKDSYKFINLLLWLLPKSFGSHNELQKGFFPHFLNMKSNIN